MKVSIPSRPIPGRFPGGRAGRALAARPAAAGGQLRSIRAGAQAEDLSLSGPGDGGPQNPLTRVPAGKYLRAHTLGPERW